LSSIFLEDLISINDDEDENFHLHSTKFEIVTSWQRSNTISEELKIKINSIFDLKKFTTQQLTSTVRNSKLFSDSSILDILSKSVLDLEKNLEEKTNKLSLLSKNYSEKIKLKEAVLNQKDTELATQKDKISLLEKNHLTEKNNLNSLLNKRKLTIENQDAKISGLVAELETQKNELISKTRSFRIDLDLKWLEISNKDWMIRNLQTELETLKNEITIKTKDFNEKLDWNDLVIRSYHSENEDLKADINKKEEEIEDLESENEELSRRSRRYGYRHW